MWSCYYPSIASMLLIIKYIARLKCTLHVPVLEFQVPLLSNQMLTSLPQFDEQPHYVKLDAFHRISTRCLYFELCVIFKSRPLVLCTCVTYIDSLKRILIPHIGWINMWLDALVMWIFYFMPSSFIGFRNLDWWGIPHKMKDISIISYYSWKQDKHVKRFCSGPPYFQIPLELLCVIVESIASFYNIWTSQFGKWFVK